MCEYGNYVAIYVNLFDQTAFLVLVSYNQSTNIFIVKKEKIKMPIA